EWFYRLLKEPSRIGRMMVLPKFVVEVKKSKKQDQQ
ncbi:MAG: WecB/TagA/CpsF family glycosyltransferase, partial [Lactobacillus delbrueckii]